MGSTLWKWTQETGLEHLAITLSDPPPRGPGYTPDQLNQISGGGVEAGPFCNPPNPIQ